VFAECLPGKLAFSDVDAIAEVNGKFLLQEWKDGQNIPVGQRIMYQRMTADSKFVVFVVDGNAENMEIRHVGTFWNGKFKGWETKTLEQFKGEQGDNYRKWLSENAEDFGIDPEAIKGMKQPVLVRERKTQVDRAEFAREANQSDLASMSPLELAKADSKRLTDTDIGSMISETQRADRLRNR
jgi:hypothetical protein